jgi:hypothetical protein
VQLTSSKVAATLLSCRRNETLIFLRLSMPEALHVQRVPCPNCKSLRTIQTDRTAITETLSCPDCAYTWDRDVPPEHAPAKRRRVTAIPDDEH